MVLLCALYGGAFLELFDNERLMAGRSRPCSAPAASSTPTPARRCRRGKTNYSRRIHVDCPRLIPGYVTNMGATILLDDFTEDNGATWFLPGSHTRADQPSRRGVRPRRASG